MPLPLDLPLTTFQPSGGAGVVGCEVGAAVEGPGGETTAPEVGPPEARLGEPEAGPGVPEAGPPAGAAQGGAGGACPTVELGLGGPEGGGGGAVEGRGQQTPTSFSTLVWSSPKLAPRMSNRSSTCSKSGRRAGRRPGGTPPLLTPASNFLILATQSA